MRRILFRLSMPNRASWDGKWTGDERNYVRVVNLSNKIARELGVYDAERSWDYHWSDGWSARVSARPMFEGEKKPKSDGFCGYGWMVDSILTHGEIRT